MPFTLEPAAATLLATLAVVVGGLAYWGYEVRRMIVRDRDRADEARPSAVQKVIRESGVSQRNHATAESDSVGRAAVSYLLLAKILLSDAPDVDLDVSGAGEFVKRISSGRIGGKAAAADLRDLAGETVPLDSLSARDRISIFRGCVVALAADEEDRAETWEYLGPLGEQLGLTRDTVVDQLADFEHGTRTGWSGAGRADDDRRARTILGVDGTFSEDQLRERYRFLIRKYHPDRARSGSVRHRVYGEITRRLNWAHDHLSGDARRQTG